MEKRSGPNRRARSRSAAIDGNALYVPLADGRLVAMQLETGQELWSRALGRRRRSRSPTAIGSTWGLTRSSCTASTRSRATTSGLEGGDAHHRRAGGRRRPGLLRRDGQSALGAEPRHWQSTLEVRAGVPSHQWTGRHGAPGRGAGNHGRVDRADR